MAEESKPQMTKSKKQPDDVRIKSRKDIGKLRRAVEAYKKDTGKTHPEPSLPLLSRRFGTSRVPVP